jgi:hypothetical protein
MYSAALSEIARASEPLGFGVLWSSQQVRDGRRTLSFERAPPAEDLCIPPSTNAGAIMLVMKPGFALSVGEALFHGSTALRLLAVASVSLAPAAGSGAIGMPSLRPSKSATIPF